MLNVIILLRDYVTTLHHLYTKEKKIILITKLTQDYNEIITTVILFVETAKCFNLTNSVYNTGVYIAAHILKLR